MDAEAELRKLLPDASVARRILRYVAAVPNKVNRRNYARWIVVQLKSPGATAATRPVDSVYRGLHGIQVYLEGLGKKTVKQATQADFQRIWSAAIRGAGRNPNHPGKRRSGDVVDTYQRQCRAFIDFVEPGSGAKKAIFKRQSIRFDGTLARCVSWDTINKISGKINGFDFVFWAVLVGSGAPPEEVRQLRLDAVSFQGSMALIKFPPFPGSDKPRVLWIAWGDAALAAYVTKLREDQPNQVWLWPNAEDPTKCMSSSGLWRFCQRMAECGELETLAPEQLQLTFIVHLLADKERRYELYARHAMGVKKTDRIRRIVRAIDESREQGHHFDGGHRIERLPTPGRIHCIECGKPDNPLNSSYCGNCREPLPRHASGAAVELLAQVQRTMTEVRELIGESRDDRAALALSILEEVDGGGRA